MTADRPPSRGLRESKKERTRAALADAALALISEHGYEATTVEAIARTADVSVRTFHNYFPGKAALFAHLSVLALSEYTEFLAAQPDDLSCAEAMSRAWLAILAAHPTDLDGLRAVLEVMDSQHEIKAHLTESTPEASAPLRAEIARRLGTDPDTSVQTWFALMICVAAPALVLRSGEHGISGADHPEDLLSQAFDTLTALTRTTVTR